MKTIALCLAAVAVSSVFAACPNQCSGHGRCTENDICECYKQTGTTWRQRVGYSGADCSQRTCPLGIAYDQLSTKRGTDIAPVKAVKGADFAGESNNNDGGSFFKAIARNYALGETKSFSIRISQEFPISPVGGDAVKYQWKLDEHEAYSAPVDFITYDGTNYANACSKTNPCELVNNGENTGNTGIYIYSTADTASLTDAANFKEGNLFSFTYDHQEGRPFEYGQENNAHQHIECSGRGSCDVATGRCTCYAGFSGEACQRTVCPNDCSGHGVCQDLARFSLDAQSSNPTAYTGYDKNMQMGCRCDDGFRGPDCTLVECPSGDDPMGYFGGDGTDAAGTNGPAMDCSGRGLCDYTSGQCTCFKGYFGERCEYQTNFV